MTDANKIEVLIAEELQAMNERHKDTNPVRFNTPHEAWAVTLEEVEEAGNDYDKVELYMRCIKELVFGVFDDKDKKQYLRDIKNVRDNALHCIQELIQVCACCDKAVR